jgi:hypothetical protein
MGKILGINKKTGEKKYIDKNFKTKEKAENYLTSFINNNVGFIKNSDCEIESNYSIFRIV